MEESNQEPTGYNVIISKVDEHNFASILKHFMDVFSLEKEPAEQILKSVPIVFLQELNNKILRKLKGRLLFFSKMGVEFTIVSHLSPTIPCVVWAGKTPNYGESPTGELIKYVDFQWKGTAFVCPNCSETFVFSRIGNPLATSVKFADDSSKTNTANEGRQVNKPVKNIPGKTSAKATDNVLEIQNPQLEDNSEEVIEVQPIEEVAEDAPVSHKPLNKAIKSQTSQEDIGNPDPVLEPIPEPIEPELEPIAKPQRIVEAAPPEKANCNVFLISIPPDKKVKAAELLARLKGVSIQQARGLIARSVSPVLQDVTKSVANNFLEEFKKIGVKGRITFKV